MYSVLIVSLEEAARIAKLAVPPRADARRRAGRVTACGWEWVQDALEWCHVSMNAEVRNDRGNTTG